MGGTEGLLKSFESIKARWPGMRVPYSSLIVDRSSPVPPILNRRRVQGQGANDDENSFIDGGVFDLRCVLNIAEVHGMNFDPDSVVVDWGVGCARMSRHLPLDLRPRFIGLDVDPVNILWCRENMGFGEYHVIDPYGVTSLSDRSCDLIYSHSVMTHLSEADQNHWLAELNRISRGLIILSVHGLVSATVVDWTKDRALLDFWFDRGFVNSPEPNPDIADVTDPEYYRDVAHTPSYIQEIWNNYLEVVDIIPGGFGPIHDAVVCRSKL